MWFLKSGMWPPGPGQRRPVWAGDLVTPVSGQCWLSPGSPARWRGAGAGRRGPEASWERRRCLGGAELCLRFILRCRHVHVLCPRPGARWASVCAAPAAVAGGLELGPRRQARWPSAASAATGWYTQQRGTPRLPLSVLRGEISDRGRVGAPAHGVGFGHGSPRGSPFSSCPKDQRRPISCDCISSACFPNAVR